MSSSVKKEMQECGSFKFVVIVCSECGKECEVLEGSMSGLCSSCEYKKIGDLVL
jgi:hypothetical protein